MNSTHTKVLPDVDPEVGTRIGDEILLDAAKAEKIRKVKGGGRRSSLQSHQARAWTRGGNVD